MSVLMKNISIFILITFFSLPALAQSNYSRANVEGKGPVIEKTLQLNAFNAIKLSISADVKLTQGSTQSVKVKGQENIIALIDTEVEDKAWRIRTTENIRKHKGLTFYITLPELKSMKISGSGDVSTTNQFSTAGTFDAAVSGSGELKLQIKAKAISSRVSGSGDVTLKGSAGHLDIQISGSGDINASDLKATNCSVKITGSGDCAVHADKQLDVKIVGSGDVKYTGGAAVRKKVLGSGDVVKGD